MPHRVHPLYKHNYGKYEPVFGKFSAPANVAFRLDNVIAVADTGNHRVQVFQPNGTFAFKFGSFGSGPGNFNGPSGVTFSPAGLLAVYDTGNHRVQVFRLE